MPLYEYECTVCGHRFEVIQSFSAAPIETCKKCGAPVLKLLSAPAIHFKGTGWYVTDYGKMKGGDQGSATGHKTSESSKSADASSTSSAAASSGSSSGASSDSSSSKPSTSSDSSQTSSTSSTKTN